jgi:4-amino-4-deoxy-L-arabinose transferase-like glycosyltransferase
MNTDRLWLALLLLILACVYGAELATLRDGHDWGGDFSLYIMHAGNVARGQPYAATPFVYNPAAPYHSPRAYPPVYPVLLAPAYAAYGVNYTAFKAVTCLFLPLACLVLYWIAREDLPRGWSAAVAAIAVLNPVFISFRDAVLPDVPYMFFSLLALWVSGRFHSTGRTLWWIAFAGAAWLAYGTRSNGIVLLPAFVLAALWKRPRPVAAAAGVVVTFLVLALAASRWASYSNQSYLSLLNWSPGIFLDNAVEYARSFAFTWANGYFRPAQYLVFAASLPLAAAGVWRRLKGGLETLELYFVFYLGLLIVWPTANGIRYLLPLLPIYMLYTALGLDFSLHAWLPGRSPRLRYAILAALVAVVLAGYASRYTTLPRGPIRDGVLQPEFTALASYIKSQTGPGDLCVFWNPRVLALATGHPAMTYANARPDAGWSSFRLLDAKYIITSSFYPDDKNILKPAVASHPGEVTLVYSNSQYSMYSLSRP